MAARFGRSSPDPGFGPVVELRRCHLHRSLDLISIGETLSSEGIATEETSPALLQIEPAGPFGNKDVLEARMIRQPGTGFQAVMTEIICNNENVPSWVVGLDVLEQLNVVLGIACSSASGHFFAVTDPQGSRDPDLVITTTVLQRCFDARILPHSCSVKRGLRPDPARMPNPSTPCILNRAR